MELFKDIALFVVGMIFLIKGGDWFVDGAAGLARRAHLPEILIGATIVSIGTTLPEVMVSSTGALKGLSATAYGNAVGSVICNTALIAAVTAAVRPMKVDRRSFSIPVAFFFGSAAIYLFCAYYFGKFTRPVGIAFLAVFVIYMTFTVWQAFRQKDRAPEEAPEKPEGSEEPEEPEKPMPLWKSILLLVVGAALIAFGAKFLVEHGTNIAHHFKVPETVITLTFVALGTSLPELVTAISALIKGHSDLSIGNVVGANLFNLVLVSGMATTLAPFEIPAEKQLAGMNASFVVDLPLMIVVMAILCLPSLIRNRLSRWQGVLLLLLYAGFCTFQFVF